MTTQPFNPVINKWFKPFEAWLVQSAGSAIQAPVLNKQGEVICDSLHSAVFGDFLPAVLYKMNSVCQLLFERPLFVFSLKEADTPVGFAMMASVDQPDEVGVNTLVSEYMRIIFDLAFIELFAIGSMPEDGNDVWVYQGCSICTDSEGRAAMPGPSAAVASFTRNALGMSEHSRWKAADNVVFGEQIATTH
ncbi:MAG: hypothetical protein D6712_20010 [Chloroflexi bacterium]|nr:MAG: hypothetical protein D6712_20010 [Chloroflexota bacterium]